MASTNRLRSWRRRLVLADASGYRLALVALLVGQLVSWTGNRIYQLALPLLVIERYGVNLSLGLVLAVRLIPTILLGPWAGVVTDRLPRRLVIAAGSVTSAVVVLLIPFTATIAQLYLLSALLGVVDSLVRPANFALLPEVFPGEQLLRVNTAREVLDAVSNVAGPGLAIALVSAFGLTGAFAADSLSFLVVALTLLALKPLPGTEADGADSEHVSGRMPFGHVWRILRGNPSLLALLSINAAYSLGVAILVVLYAPLALQGLRVGEWGYGLLVTATGVGALIGAVLAPRFHTRLTPSVALALLCVSGALLVLVSVQEHPWVVATLLGIALVPESAVFLVFSTRSQREVPRGMVGRYFGTVFAALSILLPTGNFLGGVLASGLGASTGMALVGLGFVVAASGGWLWTKRSDNAVPPGRRS